MRHASQGVRWWVLASAGSMAVGAFGPWLKAVGMSVSGTDGSKDSWLVVVVAGVGGLAFYAMRTQRAAGSAEMGDFCDDDSRGY